MRLKLFCIIFSLSLFLGAQEDNTDDLFLNFDEDSLFGLTEEDAVVEILETKSPLDSLEVEENEFLWGGKIYSDLGTSFIWNELDGLADDTTWDPQFGLDLFFDARPNSNFRVFAKAKAFYPFDLSDGESVTIHELFTDFNWDNKAYFRVGKQTINWGVGYLYTATDKLNISPVDPTNFNGDIEGPLALKTQIPLGTSTLYLYTVANEIEEPEDITYAPKIEFLLGNWELGIGGILNQSLTPKGSLFVTGPLGKLDFFAESLIQYGSDLDFYSQIDPTPVIVTKEDQLMQSTTAGIFYYNSDKRFLSIAQYWYDAESQSADDWDTIGHHYAGVTIEKGFLLQPDTNNSGTITLSLLYLGDLSDQSGMIMPEIEWEPIEYASITLGATFRYGNDLSYYNFTGVDSSSPPFEIKLSFSLGYGSF
ncbi:MAG: hypothetical protein OCD02_09475 [Spirochaetaceae bacterium]